MTCFAAKYIIIMSIVNIIPGVPEKAEWWIFSTLRAKSIIFVYVIRSNIFRRKIDTKINKFGGNFDSMAIS